MKILHKLIITYTILSLTSITNLEAKETIYNKYSNNNLLVDTNIDKNFNQNGIIKENNQQNDPTFENKINYKNDLATLFANNEAIIYEINIRTFNALDLNNNDIIEFEKGEKSGTFINAIDRLDQLLKFHINTIHILPITKIGKIKSIGTAGSVYALNSFTELNEQLDEKNNDLDVKEEAKKFVQECHKRNIRVIVDLPSCGAYDYFLSNPELFLKKNNKLSIIPADWLDVRLFKTINPDNSLNQDILELHKKYIDLMFELNVDGIRADVATLKPFNFWNQLINYAKSKDKEFLFLAEASDSWNESVSPYVPFTNFNMLLKAGFDGYYGSFFNFKNFNSASQLEQLVNFNIKLSKKYNYKKSAIGCFSTHDELSPILIGGKNFSIMTMWLNATLPFNPYFVDGIYGADDYIYKYSNKKADVTFTDDNVYYVHEGKFDIFNFSRKPLDSDPILISELVNSMQFRKSYQNIINKGNFRLIKTNNKNIFAFIRSFGKQNIIVILNKDTKSEQKINIKIKINGKIRPIRSKEYIKYKDKVITGIIQPSDILVFFVE